MKKSFLLIGCLSGAFSVILGAFAAHELKARLSPEQLQIFDTGVKYQFYHTFALLFVGLLMDKFSGKFIFYSGISFIFGIILFSGSLYLLSMKTILGIENWTWLGPVTPLGGLCFIIGWLFLFVGILKNNWNGQK